MPRKYLVMLRTLFKSSIFRSMVYSKLWHIQNHKHMQNPGIFRKAVCSEPWNTQNLRQIQNPAKHLQWSSVQIMLTAIVVSANYICFCNVIFSCSPLFNFNKSQFLAPKVFILYKKHSGPED